MPRLTTEIDSRNASRIRARLDPLDGVPSDVLHRIGVLLNSAPDPDVVSRYLHQFWRENPNAFLRIASQVTTLRYLMAVFSYSAFLSEAVLKNPQWLEDLGRSGDMHRVLMAEEYETRLRQLIGWDSDQTPSAVELARFRREQVLRIVIRDVLGLGTLSDVTEELSNLADAILDLSYRRIRASMTAIYGEPVFNGHPAQFSVIALGKLGGRELNYSSDIDLMFIYEGSGDTEGPHSISNKEFFKKIANSYTELLSTYTGGGMCYRVDLRLRPDGRYGEVCHSLEGAQQYYKTRGRDWELQMLIKGRVAAGEPGPGTRLLEFVEPLIYSTTLDFKAVESVSEARERINEKLKRSAHAGLDVKLARGGIRDIEFLVQCLQRKHGGREPWVRHGGTLFALFRLRDKDLLSDSEYSRLAAAYQFLRNLEHRLQFDEDRQVHTLPQNMEALELLARKMPQSQTGTLPTMGTLQRELDSHFEAVRELYDRVVRSQRPAYYAAAPPPQDDSGDSELPLGTPAPVPSAHLARYLDTRAPNFSEAIARTGPHDARLEYLIEKLITVPEYLDSLDHDAELRSCTLDVFNHSRYFADQLVRYPELLHEIAVKKEKVLIFTEFLDMIDTLKRVLPHLWPIEILTIDGRIETTERQANIDRFSAAEGFGVMALNPKTAGMGLNITAANHVIHYTRQWNPALEEQASARSYRNGQKKAVNIYYLYYADTIEEVIDERLRNKTALSGEVITVTDTENMEDYLNALQLSPLK